MNKLFILVVCIVFAACSSNTKTEVFEKAVYQMELKQFPPPLKTDNHQIAATVHNSNIHELLSKTQTKDMEFIQSTVDEWVEENDRFVQAKANNQ